MPVIVQLTDTHLTTRPGPQDEALARAVAAVMDELGIQPDLVALTGDLADDGSVEALERVRAAVAPLGAPILAIGGNHDRPEAITEVFGAPKPLTLDGWRIVPLDTCVPGEIHGAADVATARQRLDEDRTTPTAIFVHHPPIGPSAHEWFTLVGRAELLELLAERPNVRALGAGHLHQTFQGRDRHLLVVGAPSTWYAIRHEGHRWAKARSAPVGATVWHLDADGTPSASLVIAPS